MAPQAVFYQACPVCGRSIRMPLQCFGRQVTCVHCGGEFRAAEQADPPAGERLPPWLRATALSQPRPPAADLAGGF